MFFTHIHFHWERREKKSLPLTWDFSVCFNTIWGIFFQKHSKSGLTETNPCCELFNIRNWVFLDSFYPVPFTFTCEVNVIATAQQNFPHLPPSPLLTPAVMSKHLCSLKKRSWTFAAIPLSQMTSRQITDGTWSGLNLTIHLHGSSIPLSILVSY